MTSIQDSTSHSPSNPHESALASIGERAGMRVEPAWIPMGDGVRLAVTLYRPMDAGQGSRFPVLLEYLPYRKDDQMLERDLGLYSYVVRRGYVGARVDLRGTGASEGIVPDREYSEQEMRDGLEVIEWLGTQPWSSGAVGMWGISWGGFNSIQLAMRRPPRLGAIVALMASDDLFHDDIHYIDGMLHVDEWEPMMDLLNAMTSAPDYPVDEEALARRFDSEPWKLEVLRHQRGGPRWTRESLSRDYGSIDAATLVIGGWFDGYRDSVLRMVERLRAPVRGIVGPWNHSFPHDATPGPEIEWRAEAVRWFDRWLKGEPNGAEGEPRLVAYVRRWHPPDPSIATIPGEWRAFERWPPPDLEERPMWLRADGSLGGEPGAGEGRGEAHELAYVPSMGAEAGVWWGEVPPDQAPLDAECLRYDSAPLGGELVVVGMPRVVLRVSADAPLAHWFVRLCDVAPDGTSTLVAGGGANGAHRSSTSDPAPLAPGRMDTVRFDLRFAGWTFEAGHRIRIAVSNAMWPMIWPTPFPMTTRLHPGASHVVVPVLPGGGMGPAPRFDQPAGPLRPAGVRSWGDALPGPLRVRRHGPTVTAEWSGTAHLELPGCRQSVHERMAFTVRDDDPAHASALGVNETTVELPERTLTWRGELDLRSDPTHLDYRYRRRLREDGRLLRERTWEERIPRDHQ